MPTPDYINRIVNNLGRERCLIVLGPRAGTDAQQLHYDEGLFQYVKSAVERSGDAEAFERDEDGLFFIKGSRAAKRLMRQKAEEYAGTLLPQPFHRQLAGIQAPLLMSLTPDRRLRQAFDDAGYAYTYAYFNKQQPRNGEEIPYPARSSPVIYNLCGDAEKEEDSLLLTQQDVLDFLFAGLGNGNMLPKDIQSYIQRTKIILLLGFDFTKWYIKLIMRMLNVHAEELEGLAAGKIEAEQQHAVSYYKNHFELVFINDDVENCIADLYEACGRNLLIRTPGSTAPNTAFILDGFVRQIAEGQLGPVLLQLIDYVQVHAPEIQGEVVQLSSWYHRTDGEYRAGRMQNNDHRVEINKIEAGVLALIGKLKM